MNAHIRTITSPCRNRSGGTRQYGSRALESYLIGRRRDRGTTVRRNRLALDSIGLPAPRVLARTGKVGCFRPVPGQEKSAFLVMLARSAAWSPIGQGGCAAAAGAAGRRSSACPGRMLLLGLPPPKPDLKRRPRRRQNERVFQALRARQWTHGIERTDVRRARDPRLCASCFHGGTVDSYKQARARTLLGPLRPKPWRERGGRGPKAIRQACPGTVIGYKDGHPDMPLINQRGVAHDRGPPGAF